MDVGKFSDDDIVNATGMLAEVSTVFYKQAVKYVDSTVATELTKQYMTLMLNRKEDKHND